MAKELSAGLLSAIDITERVCSSLSLLGCAFIILTFISSSAFHKPINRLVFYASVGNIMSNVATLIARDSLSHLESSLCQFQGFLIQMFMPADAYWTLAMAANVYLTFYWKFDAEKLRRLEIYYFILCYGIPFVPAITYVFIKSKTSRMYGDATLWCWITDEWDVLRIVTFYAPVWVVIAVSICIYLRAGQEIYHKHAQLKDFSRNHSLSTSGIEDPFSFTTREVHIVSEVRTETSQAVTEDGKTTQDHTGPKGYTVNISTSTPALPPSDLAEFKRTTTSGQRDTARPPGTSAGGAGGLSSMNRKRAQESTSAAWGYAKVAVLFFTAMLITWIPSSANRVYSVMHPGHVSPALEYLSAFVLPLQGFWNAVIYIMTSRHACKSFYRDLMCGSLGNGDDGEGIGISFRLRSSRGTRLGSRGHLPDASESMTELATVSVTPAKSIDS